GVDQMTIDSGSMIDEADSIEVKPDEMLKLSYRMNLESYEISILSSLGDQFYRMFCGADEISAKCLFSQDGCGLYVMSGVGVVCEIAGQKVIQAVTTRFPDEIRVLSFKGYSKIALWHTLANTIDNWDVILVMMGDFNEVREAGERFGSTFNKKQAQIFNAFIANAYLIVIPLGVVLEKGTPDHCPILLKEFEVDCGPTTFWFFHSWMEIEGFHKLVFDTWNNDGIVEANGLISFKKTSES
ncbi:hypothetical protein Tco_1391934, partial [Tanacetum coccineum]